MKVFASSLLVLAVLVLLGASTVAHRAVAETYKVKSLAPGLSPFVLNSAITKIVNTRVADVTFQLSATGTATRHMLDAARGEVDFLFGSPTINWMMVNRLGPYRDVAEAPDLEKRVGMILAYRMGPYHYITDAGSGIERLADLRGRTVFAGPPGGAATQVVLRVIEQSAGIMPDEMALQAFGFDAAIQAFQDGKIDVIVLQTNVPSAAVRQFALTREIRLLDVDMADVTVQQETGGTVEMIAPDAYGSNQVNETAIETHGSIVNFSAGLHVPEEVVYQVTKAIWEHLDDVHGVAEWLPNALTADIALSLIAGRLHPGAERYYREQGWAIPAPTTFTPTQ